MYEETQVVKNEEINVDLYVIRSKDGRWLRFRLVKEFKKCWVRNISRAKIFSSPAAARAKLEKLKIKFPEMDDATLVLIKTGYVYYLEHGTRAKGHHRKATIEKYSKLVKDLDNRIMGLDREHIKFEDKMRKLLKEKHSAQKMLDRLKKMDEELRAKAQY